MLESTDRTEDFRNTTDPTGNDEHNMSIMDKIILVALVSLFTAVTAEDAAAPKLRTFSNLITGCIILPTKVKDNSVLDHVLAASFREAFNEPEDSIPDMAYDGPPHGAAFQCEEGNEDPSSAFQCEEGNEDPSAYVYNFHWTYS